MQNRDRKDNKFIKDKWFDDYCFYKLVIEEEEEKQPTSSKDPSGCGYTLMAIILFLMFFFEIIEAFY